MVGLEVTLGRQLVGGIHRLALLGRVFRQRFGPPAVDQPRGREYDPGPMAPPPQEIQQMQQAQLVDGEIARVLVKALMGARQPGEHEERVDVCVYGIE